MCGFLPLKFAGVFEAGRIPIYRLLLLLVTYVAFLEKSMIHSAMTTAQLDLDAPPYQKTRLLLETQPVC